MTEYQGAKRGPKRKKNQRLAHRRQLARWLYEGEMTVAEMAEELGVSEQQVYYDIALLKEQWRKETVEDLEARKDRLLSELRMLRRYYRAGWLRSLGDKTKTTSGVGKFGPMEMTETENQSGDAKFLDGYLKTLGEEARLFGLYDAINTDATLAEVLMQAIARAQGSEGPELQDLDELEAVDEDQDQGEDDTPAVKTLNRKANGERG